MIQEKLKLPTSAENDPGEDMPSSSHQLISQTSQLFNKSFPPTTSSSFKGKPATLPKRFNRQMFNSPSVESSFRQAAIQQQQQQQQQQYFQQQKQQQQSFYLQQLHHPSYNQQQHMLQQQPSSSAASPLEMKEFKNEGDLLNRFNNFSRKTFTIACLLSQPFVSIVNNVVPKLVPTLNTYNLRFSH